MLHLEKKHTVNNVKNVISTVKYFRGISFYKAASIKQALGNSLLLKGKWICWIWSPFFQKNVYPLLFNLDLEVVFQKNNNLKYILQIITECFKKNILRATDSQLNLQLNFCSMNCKLLFINRSYWIWFIWNDSVSNY